MQSAGSISTMNTKAFLATLTCLLLLRVEGRGPGVTRRNGTTDFGNVRRILNGQVANPADFPYLVRLRKGSLVCGGSVISDYYILTAAHCLHGTQCSTIEVFPSTWEQGSVSRISVSECYPHQKYVITEAPYDVGLLKTLDNLLIHGGFKAIPLPAPGTHYLSGTAGVIVGWGKTENVFDLNRFMRGDVLVQDWNTCNYKVKHLFPTCVSDTQCPIADIPRRALCTQGHGSRPSTACDGDSGGPVIVDGVIAGVVVGIIVVNGRCTAESPSIHMNVVDFLPWIYHHIDPERDTSQYPVTAEAPVGHPVGNPIDE